MNIEPSVLTQDLLNDFGLILYEISNCRRQIAAYIAFGQIAKAHKNTEINNLCGWSQDALLRLIVIDSFKIFDGSREIIKEIVSQTKYSDIVIDLFKAAELDRKCKELNKIILPWRPHRNKRFAHMESSPLETCSLDLIPLASSLKSLSTSVGFVMHYLTNPRYIEQMNNKDQALFVLTDSEVSKNAFHDQTKDDRVIKMINKLVQKSIPTMTT